MKKVNFQQLGCELLSTEEISLCNGGAVPGENTSPVNDFFYYFTLGLIAFSKGVRAFGAGAAKGQSLRFSG